MSRLTRYTGNSPNSARNCRPGPSGDGNPRSVSLAMAIDRKRVSPSLTALSTVARSAPTLRSTDADSTLQPAKLWRARVPNRCVACARVEKGSLNLLSGYACVCLIKLSRNIGTIPPPPRARWDRRFRCVSSCYIHTSFVVVRTAPTSSPYRTECTR